MIRSGRPRESTAECAACSADADLGTDVRGVLGRDRLLLGAAALEHGAHVLAVDMLHRDEVLAVRARELVDARDVAVAQDARDLRLVDEHLDEVVVLGEVREHALDRDEVGVAVSVERLRAIDLRHATERDAIEQVVATELLSPSHRL